MSSSASYLQVNKRVSSEFVKGLSHDRDILPSKMGASGRQSAAGGRQ